MEALKPFFPFVFSSYQVKANDVVSLVISILIHLIAGAIVGTVLFWVSSLISILGIFTGLIGALFDLYCLGGIILAVVKFLGKV